MLIQNCHAQKSFSFNLALDQNKVKKNLNIFRFLSVRKNTWSVMSPFFKRR
jgi:hypothetical protein